MVQKGIIFGQKKIHLIKDEIDFLGITIRNGEIHCQDHSQQNYPIPKQHTRCENATTIFRSRKLCERFHSKY